MDGSPWDNDCSIYFKEEFFLLNDQYSNEKATPSEDSLEEKPAFSSPCSCFLRTQSQLEKESEIQSLVEILTKFYHEGASVDEVESQKVTSEEKELLFFALKKKFVVKERALQSISKKPKSENRWKFVVKKCIKFMKRRVKYNS